MKLAQIDFGRLEQEMGLSPNPTSIGNIISNLIPYLFAAAGFLLTIYLVWGGLDFMFSMGDPKKISAARGKITQALIGFFVVFVSFLLIQLIGTIFNIPDFQTIFK